MNAEAVYTVHRRIIPAALDLLPAQMASDRARAMLLAIGLQESGFEDRTQQPSGQARGYWQFEQSAVATTLMQHAVIAPVLQTLNYRGDTLECHRAMADNDVLAAVFARLLLWSVPGALPTAAEPDRGWQQYLVSWRPGKPRPATWPAYFTEAWRTVREEV